MLPTVVPLDFEVLVNGCMVLNCRRLYCRGLDGLQNWNDYLDFSLVQDVVISEELWACVQMVLCPHPEQIVGAVSGHCVIVLVQVRFDLNNTKNNGTEY